MWMISLLCNPESAAKINIKELSCYNPVVLQTMLSTYNDDELLHGSVETHE